MTTRGVILAIHLQSGPGQPPTPVEVARALQERGMEGDFHGKHRPGSSRQVLLVDRRTLEAHGFAHGALREQLTVDLPGLDGLARGTRLAAGEAVLEVTGPCEPCEVIGQLNGVPDPYALRDALVGRRGILTRVVAVAGQGVIRRGEMVEVVPHDPAPNDVEPDRP